MEGSLYRIKLLFFSVTGYKELGVRPIDPLEIKTMHVPGHGGNVDIDQTYNDIKLYGLSNVKLNSFRYVNQIFIPIRSLIIFKTNYMSL